MSKSFNVVIATAGRPSLQRMVDSIAPQLTECDYLTIIWDCQPMPLQIDSDCQVISLHNPEPLGFWGHGSRTRWQNELPGDYFINGDDDDVFDALAMNTIRSHCTEKKLYIFKMSSGGTVIPLTDEVRIGNVGTPCGVYPKIDNLPSWGEFYGGDGHFYVELSKILPVEFVRKIIYIIDPNSTYNEYYKPTMICDCGMEAGVSFDRMIMMWKGYCARCQKEIR